MINRYINIISPTFISTTGSGVTYDEMEDYVAEHCVPSGTVTLSGVSYEDMVDYVAEHCVVSGTVTLSGITYDDMVDYVSSVTGSGYVSCLDGAEITLTFPDTLIQSSFFPVVTKTVVSGVTINITKGCEDEIMASGISYQQMVDYVSDQLSGYPTTYSGIDGIITTINDQTVFISGQYLYDTLMQEIIDHSGGVTVSGIPPGEEYAILVSDGLNWIPTISGIFNAEHGTFTEGITVTISGQPVFIGDGFIVDAGELSD